tara:strand:+ start:749083 stop:749532 length:450 start_codon:yes stop_codon:yes gene_type:complete
MMTLQLQTYKSVHDYLDELFEGKNPSNESVVLAKKEYWKAYNLNLIRNRRKENHEFSVSFSKSEFKIIQDMLTKKQAVSQFIRRVVLDSLNEGTSANKQIDTEVIEQQLFLIAEYLKELIEDEIKLHEEKLNELHSRILELQNKIESSF